MDRAEGESPRQTLVDQAVGAMVHQFARPFDFLRELAQNALDAGSPRVDVRLEEIGVGPRRWVKLSVEDVGSGMDERVIDEDLTCLFASSKEGDLTAVGQFGVGFTSVFAVKPAAVLVRTGRAGEGWELRFHRDRSFDKIRLDRPVRGTVVMLLLDVEAVQVDRLVAEVEGSLRLWCEHMEIPLWLHLCRAERAEEEPSQLEEDPFAAFARSAGAPAADRRRIDRPLDLAESGPVVHLQEDDREVVLAAAERPEVAFYSGGLTLARGAPEALLGELAGRCRSWSFKVRAPGLRTTLSRDSVRRDEAFEAAMRLVLQAGTELVRRQLVELEEIAAGDASLDAGHARLADELEAGCEPRDLPRLGEACILRLADGSAVGLAQLLRSAALIGAILVESGDAALDEAAVSVGLLVIEDAPGTRRLLQSLPPLGWLGRAAAVVMPDAGWARPPPIQRVDKRYRLVRPVGEVDAASRRLIEGLQELLRRRRLARWVVAVREGGAVLAERVPAGRGLLRRGRGGRLGPGARLALDLDHEAVGLALEIRELSERAAVYSLAQQVLVAMGMGSDARLSRLFEAVR